MSRVAQFKLVLLGESAVGKSSVLLRFAKKKYEDNRESTIGAAFLAQSVKLPDSDVTVRFEIWDTAGQERYKSLAPMYYRNANAALVVFDLTSKDSFSRAKGWVRELRAQASEKIVIALVGNKSDLPNREVDINVANEYATEFDLLYFECSAKTGENVELVFKKVAEKMPVEEYFQQQEEEDRRAVDLATSSQAKGCAC